MTETATINILASDGSDADDQSAWIVVDSHDSALAEIPYTGQSVDAAIEQMVTAGYLPAGAKLARVEPMPYPYSWQIADHERRYVVTVPNGWQSRIGGDPIRLTWVSPPMA